MVAPARDALLCFLPSRAVHNTRLPPAFSPSVAAGIARDCSTYNEYARLCSSTYADDSLFEAILEVLDALLDCWQQGQQIDWSTSCMFYANVSIPVVGCILVNVPVYVMAVVGDRIHWIVCE